MIVVVAANVLIGVVQEVRAEAHGGPARASSRGRAGDGRPRVRRARAAACRARPGRPRAALARRPGARRRRHRLRQRLHEREPAHRRGQARLQGAGRRALSGSFVDAGSLVARVTRVGAQGYAARINAEAKYVKAVRSEIQETLRAIIRLGTVALVPLGLGLFLRSVLMDGGSLDDADPHLGRRRHRHDPAGARPAHLLRPRHRHLPARPSDGPRPAGVLRRDARAGGHALPRQDGHASPRGRWRSPPFARRAGSQRATSSPPWPR